MNEIPLGNIDNLRFKIDQPMTLDFDIEYRSLNLMTGLNGSGKSLMNKACWAFGTIMSILHANPPSINEAAQYVMDKTFEQQNFNGEMEAKYPNGNLKMVLCNGKVTSVEYYVDPKVKVCTPPLYMSTNIRTFQQIDQYLKVEKMLSNKEDLLNLYRLYDVVFVELLKNKLSSGLKANDEFKKAILEQFKLTYDFDTFAIENDSVVFIDKDGKRTNLSTLSAGEQSLVNMTLVSNW